MHSYNHNSLRQTVDNKALCPMLDKRRTKSKAIKMATKTATCVSIAKLKVQALR